MIIRRLIKNTARPFLGRQWTQKTLKRLMELGRPSADDFPVPKSVHIPCSLSDPKVVNMLGEIHSETTWSERVFLYKYFSLLWSGQDDVLEIGPFLGGTTRAIAMGMMANPKRQPASRLYTYDRFKNYYHEDEFMRFLEPVFEKGLMPRHLKEEARLANSFRGIFDALHEGKEYGHLIIAQDATLPETATEGSMHANLLRIDGSKQYSAILVDGCKSWYSTKYFLNEMRRATRVGSVLIFQDYAWRKCFWIPVQLHMLREYLALIAYTDCTHAFALLKPIPEEVLNAIPDEPELCAPDFFEPVFDALLSNAKERGDRFGYVFHSLQHAAAMAYLGEKDKALGILRVLYSCKYAKDYARDIESAMRNPAYRPSGIGQQSDQIIYDSV